jgi:hypothetical protein
MTKFSKKRTVLVDSEFHHDLLTICKESSAQIADNYPPDSFQRMFWEQQQLASNVQTAHGMRWDPLMIRWCLYLRHLSSGAYNLLRESGVVSLPSQRTLRDYTYYTSQCTGFSGIHVYTVLYTCRNCSKQTPMK